MVFNSFQFAYFFAVLFPLYWLLPHRWQNVLLLAASYFFYSCWDPRFTALLLISTTFDYLCGLAVARVQHPRWRLALVAASMALNLGFLGYFKYYNFFAENLQSLFASLGLTTRLGTLQVVLPIGISFYTFQSMSYVIDIYRGHANPERSFIRFAAFVSFFPHLVAGPIMRPTTLLPQIATPRRFQLAQLYEGAYLVLWGLTKKVVVADNLARVVDDLFGRWQQLDGGLALLAIYAFAFQIYCDFSGYTDMARGVAKAIGFELALNFNLPYFAVNPRDFWARWHISLSTWLRDYLYIPLGGNRGSRWKQYRNLLLTMAIGGLWHGAAWTFVLWGVFHGLWLIVHRMLQPLLERLKPADPVHEACWTAVRVVATFHLVCLGWLLFRATSLEQVRGMLAAIGSHLALPAAAVLAPVTLLILPLLAYEYAQHRAGNPLILGRTPWYVRGLFYTGCYYAIAWAGEYGGPQFIYFQF